MELQREKDRIVELTNQTKKFKAFKQVSALHYTLCKCKFMCVYMYYVKYVKHVQYVYINMY